MGTPLAIFTLFDSTNNKFYGRINNNLFELTKQSTSYPIPYKIKGFISYNTESTTKIMYTIKPIWFGYLWIRIIPAITFLFITAVIIVHSELLFPAGLFGLFFMSMFVYNLYVVKRTLKNFEIDFKKTFEII